jgi:hypothetical protein
MERVRFKFKNWKLKFISVIVLLGMGQNVLAQKSFSRDTTKFIEEYTTYVMQVNSGEAKAETKLFKEYWSNGKFTEPQRSSINELANKMLISGMKPEPYFLLLTKCINAWVTKGLSADLLKNFIDISFKNLEKDKLGFVSFMRTCYPLFTKNVLTDNGQRQWYVRDNNYNLSDAGGFSIKFLQSDLVCRTLADSMVIYETTGTFFPNKTKWEGDAGKMTWIRHGREDAFVVFKKYTIDLSGSSISLKDVKYTNQDFFAGEVEGVFKDKVSYALDTTIIARFPYPEFSTKEANVEIKNLIGDEAKYYGGISVKGKEIFSQSFGDEPATIEILYKGKPKVIAKSSTFKISENAVISQGTEIFVLMDSGQIYHPKAIFNYNFSKKLMIVSRGKDGLTRANFQDDYHNLEFKVDNINWKQEEPFIEFDNLSSDKPAIIESSNYFKQFKYDKIQGMLAANPIEVMIRYVIKNRVRDFSLDDYAAYRRNKKKNLMKQVYDLADGGFIQYNPKTDSIRVKMKLYNYYYADKGVKDYDVIRLSSVIAARSNASLNILNDELTIEGVRRFKFSDSQFVIAVPTEQTVKVTRNRTMAFGGMIRAGRFDLFGQNFVFDYEKFATRPSTVDSLRLYFPDSNSNMRRVNSVLSNLYGVLEIDKPNNKSGLKNFPRYPRFISERGSEITYERRETHNYAYKAKEFKFIVDPFTIDSMDNFTLAGFNLDGTFVSAGIFPDFRYKASIQEDYSLGFKTKTPAGGFPMYRGNGKGEMNISLSNKGLYGTGKIEYSGSTIESESFLLLPNETIAKANSFKVPENGKYPAVVGANLGTSWKPYEDKMSLATSNSDASIKVFKMGYDFVGEMKVTPNNLRGDGLLKWSEAEFTSKDMVYETNGVTADSGAIKIFAADSNKIAFNATNLKSDIDFTKREGKFTSNNSADLTHLPFNQYASNMNDYKWNMDDKTIDINLGKMDGAVPYFVATKPGVDSLKFEAKHALFDIESGVLAIDQIPYIDVADSRVFPSDGKAIVRENAEMDTLYDSKIDVNRVDKYHQFYSCKTKVIGKNQLKANGLFIYENKHGKQEVFFDSIFAQNKVVYADAYVDGKDNFVVDRLIGYKGVMRVRGNSQKNHLFGYVKPLHGFDSFPSKWVRLRDSIDRNAVVLRIGVPEDEDGRKLPIGVYGVGRGTGYYPMFYGWKERYSDIDVSYDTGIMYYDYNTRKIMIGDENRLLNKGIGGNIMSIDTTKGYLAAQGGMYFGFKYKKTEFKFGGEATFQKEDSTFTFNLLNMMKLPLPKELTDQMVLMATEVGGSAVSAKSEFVKQAFASTFTDKKEATKALKKLESSGKLISGNDAQGLLAFRVDGLRYVPREKALFSRNAIDLYQIGETQIDASFNCMYELERKRSGNVFTLYIEFSDNDWIYLNFIRGVLYVLSSDGKFNNTLPALMDKYYSEEFSIRMATPRSVGRFQDRYFDH